MEAIHIPVVVATVLYLNLKYLPEEMKPSKLMVAFLFATALFFMAFAGYYLYDLITGNGG